MYHLIINEKIVFFVSKMSTSVAWTDIMLAIGSIVIVGGFTLLIKSFLHKYRRPNGKKGGIISFHVAVAFAIVTVVAMTTKDWFLTGLTVVLAYLIGRGRLDEGQHYMYQVVVGAVIGVLIPYGIFYLYYRRIRSGSYESRAEYNDKPDRAHDDRQEADEAPELRLEDLDDLKD
uniref:PAP2 superfamily protein n=1 Tax=Marseillevirus LCMAC202 TaxID=2506606 RepID=A0A481YZD9_9VIRU|nr:MAG: PAP2 superfamily protein [Marseillevirus LCMAC202]